jgi:hypothetical protein
LQSEAAALSYCLLPYHLCVPPACLQNEVMYNGIRAQGPAASLFFILVIVVGQYMVLNLFLAVLLSNFDDDDEEEEEEEDHERLDAGIGDAAGARQVQGSVHRANDDSAAVWHMVIKEDEDVAEVSVWGTDPNQE